MDYGIVISEFELQSRYFIYFLKKYYCERYEPLYLLSYGLKSTITVLLERWIWHKKPTKIDMPLNKETKPNQTLLMRLPRCLTLFIRFLQKAWETFSFFWGTLFLFFHSSPLFDGVHFQYSQVLVIFLLSKWSNVFLILLFYYFTTLRVFHTNISRWFSLEVSWTFFSILADLNAVVLMVTTYSLYQTLWVP